MEETPSKKGPAKKWGIIYGLAGLILSLLITMLDLGTKGLAMQAVVFFVTVGLAFTVYFLAGKEFKESNNGYITLGQGFGIAFAVGLIAGAIRSVGFYLYIKLIDTNYMERVLEAQIEMQERFGGRQVDLDDLPEFVKFFQSPEFLAISTFLNVLIGALIIGLIAAAIIQKKEDYTY
jgi:hypothetical protein